MEKVNRIFKCKLCKHKWKARKVSGSIHLPKECPRCRRRNWADSDIYSKCVWISKVNEVPTNVSSGKELVNKIENRDYF